SSSLIAYFEGETSGPDIKAVDFALEQGHAVLPWIVFVEVLSDPQLPVRFIQLLERCPKLELLEGYWQRAASLRKTVIQAKLKGRLADTL
ncbi:hypothetical protein, partial [Flavonifractor plautii]|uniref:hypothetical protein n=1 Tax=Flavonifractor plautii TaxID=292800 RepID=UPI003D7EDE82